MNYNWRSILDDARNYSTPNKPNGHIEYIAKKKLQWLQELSKLTGRNVILYYSAFLQQRPSEDIAINDRDINALMENIYQLDKTKGLDLILHTPGGDLAATEQIISYLHSAFNGDIRAIIPQMAMSAGAIIAVSCKSIMMDKQSCLGPFDPQLNGVACQSVISEFYKAVDDVQKNPASLGLWQTIIAKLTPTFITSCQQASLLAEELTNNILSRHKFSEKVKSNIKKVFTDNTDSKIHSRHIDRQRCADCGLHIENLEDNQEIQDRVLGIHHCCMLLGEISGVYKMVENNIGGLYLCHHDPVSAQNPLQ